MNHIINGKRLYFSNSIRDDLGLRQSFNELAQKTFGLSFEKWYRDGFWTDRYRPYTLSDGARVVANVSVNLMDTSWHGTARRYIQLGTVMTGQAYRHMGLAEFLIRRVLEDYSMCDAVFLFANDSVLDFYPKFGFLEAVEYQPALYLEPEHCPVKKLDPSCQADIGILYQCYQKSNPLAELPMLNNFGLFMFHCSMFLRDCVYYVPSCDAVVIADLLQSIIFDVYCEKSGAAMTAMRAVAGTGQGLVKLGFALKNSQPDQLAERQEEDTTLFVHKENVFLHNRTMLPLLAHA